MADARRVIGKAVLRSSCVASLVAPIFFAWASTIDLSAARGQFADWAPMARWWVPPFALYLLGAPFVYAFYWPRRQRGESIIFLMATGGATAALGVTFAVGLLTRASPGQVHSWAGASLLVALFSCWWHRNLLACNHPF